MLWPIPDVFDPGFSFGLFGAGRSEEMLSRSRGRRLRSRWEDEVDIRALGYIGVTVADLGAWRSYAELLGTMVVPSDRDDEFRIKIDDTIGPIVSWFSGPARARALRSPAGSFPTLLPWRRR